MGTLGIHLRIRVIDEEAELFRVLQILDLTARLLAEERFGHLKKARGSIFDIVSLLKNICSNRYLFVVKLKYTHWFKATFTVF